MNKLHISQHFKNFINRLEFCKNYLFLKENEQKNKLLNFIKIIANYYIFHAMQKFMVKALPLIIYI